MRRQLWLQYIKSYLIILIAVIALMSTLSIISFELFEQDTMRKNAVLLDYIKETFDVRLSEISKLSYEVSYNERFLNLTKSGNAPDYSDAARLSNNLRILKATSEVISDIAIYFPESNLVISDSGRFTIRRFYRLTHENNDQDYARYLAMLKNRHTLEYIISDDIPNSRKPEINLNFYHTFPMAGSGSLSPVLLIRIDTAKMEQMMKTVINSNSEYFALLDNRNRPVVYSGNQQLLRQVGDHIVISRTAQVQNVSSGSLMISQISSLHHGLHYVSISEKNTLLNTLNTGKNILIIGVCSIFLFGFLIAVYFSKRTEKPIKAMARAFSGHAAADGDDMNVYDYIERNIKRIMEENTSIAKRLENQDSLLKSLFLIKLLKGDIDDADEFQRLCRQHGVDLSREHHCVFILYVHIVDAVVEKSATDFAEYGDTLSTLVATAVRQLCGEDYGAEMACIDGLYTVWLTLSDNDAPELLKERYCRNLVEKINQDYRIEMSVASGSIYDDFNQIALSYAEALQTLEHLAGDRSILYLSYATIRPIGPKSRNIALDLLSRFINCLKLQDYKNAVDLLDDLFSAYLPGHLPRELHQLHRSTLISILLAAAEQAGALYGYPGYCHSAHKLQASSAQSESFKTSAGLLLREIIACKRQYEARDFSRHINGLKDFIIEHYANPDLGLYMLATQFNMNNSYLSKIFKNEYDIGVLDYINKIRIEKSKELLARTEQSIIQIAQAVGYISDITFIRVFKRYEGTTPGRYRDSLAETDG